MPEMVLPLVYASSQLRGGAGGDAHVHVAVGAPKRRRPTNPGAALSLGLFLSFLRREEEAQLHTWFVGAQSASVVQVA